MLARLDGKSRVEYLSAGAGTEQAREFGRALCRRRPTGVDDLLHSFANATG
jgi:hypothetical protein